MSAMAPLYKRYRPPPKAEAPSPAERPIAGGASASKSAPSAPTPEKRQHADPPKRKRERTDEEVAERKAKKLRKKGIDPESVDVAKKASNPKQSKTVVQNGTGIAVAPTPTVATDAPSQPSATPATGVGDFSHVKDGKKRHKLEKEARKARIAAEKKAKAGATEQEQDVRVLDAQQVQTAMDGPHGMDQAGDVGDANDEPAGLVRRKKRRRGKDSDEVEDAVQQEPDETLDQSVVGGDGEQYDERPSQPRKRRHKLEGMFNERNAAPANVEEATDHLEKHGNVIGKFQKARKQVEGTSGQDERIQVDAVPDTTVLRDLVPLPQPEKAPTPEFVPDPNALPPWLAKPMVVADDKKCTFGEMSLDTRLTEHLSKLGFNDALPVQQALVPLLLAPGTPGARFLPGAESVLPDLTVGAPTGSGKTIAYLLPVIEALKKSAANGKLKALVVVPTRELAMQVAAVAESLAKGSRVKIGVATGSGSVEDERARLVRKESSYDPKRHEQLMGRADRLNRAPMEQGTGGAAAHDAEADTEFDLYLDDIKNLDAKEQQRLRDIVSELPGYVPSYESAVDLLVATPGRLLEHLDNTLGFTFAHLAWLMLDEADKLLDGQYSNFLQIVNSELGRPHSDDEQDVRERYLRACRRWNEDVERRVRKVVLSATMTRDISKLMGLRLKRPQMVLVRGKNGGEPRRPTDATADATSFELPYTLREYSVHTGDGSEKPLFLLQVLTEHILASQPIVSATNDDAKGSIAGHSDAGSSVDSIHSSESSDSDSDGTSSDSDSSEDGEDDEVARQAEHHTRIHPSRAAALDHDSTTPTILIFTSSTESASRLSHILTTLLSQQPAIALLTLTSTTGPKHLTKRLSSIPSSTTLIAITTDRAARGLDALGSRAVTHVVQYDVPRSATGYVHRVGRTARAGRVGQAWTLFTHSEARWFVGEIVNGAGLKRGRGSGVEKVKVGVEDEGAREKFREAVEGLREGVLSTRRR